MKHNLNQRGIGFYLGALGGIIALIAIVAYTLYGNASGERNMFVFLPLIGVVIVEIVSVVVDNDILVIVAPVLSTIALCAFIMDSVYTFVGYFFGLAMFGDVSMMGSILRVCALIGASLILLLVGSYFNKNKNVL